jgi:EAL domain-containing protein (putative c-di-GMP-specific phosphodiesterase class I)
MIQWIAESIGLNARYVCSVDEFFRELDAWTPHFITLDLVMPGVDGLEVMLRLAERKCSARIIITSGVGSRVLDAARRSAKQHGLRLAGVLPKPLTKSDLIPLVADPPEEDKALAHAVSRSQALLPPDIDLLLALERREFDVAFQPKIECLSGNLDGFEALARWNCPGYGMVPPDQFILMAERLNVIDALTDQIFEAALAWLAGNFPDTAYCMSLNVSAKSLTDFHLAESLQNLCRSHSLAPSRIILELTETSAMIDPVVSLDLLTRFRVKGFNLSIDDFGTGFSSMVQLARLPFSELKVDKSFVISSATSRESLAITKSIVDLGHSLGLRVTAEGVEDQKTLDFLKNIQCDLAQGYFISRPMFSAAAVAWAQRFKP